MNSNTPDDVIKAYLDGRLDGQERQQFEAQLAADPALAEAVARRRAERAVGEMLIASDTRALFEEWRQKPRRARLSGRSITWAAGLAAAVLVLFASTWLLRHTSAPPAQVSKLPAPSKIPAPAPLPTPEPPAPPIPSRKPAQPKAPAPNYRLIAEQRMPDPLQATLRRTSSDSVAGPLQRAKTAFGEGDYRRTLDLLALVDSSRQQAAAFLAAHALFRLHRYEAAESRFTQLINWNSKQFRYASEWGVLMCRLADYPHRKTEFWQQINEILKTPEHPLLQEAKDLKLVLKE